MGEVAEVKKEDVFKREAKVLSPWLDPAFNKVDNLGGEPGFKVDDIPERLGLVQQGQLFSSTSVAYFSDLEDAPDNYGTKLQFLQTDGKGKLDWAWPFWSKSGSTVYYKSGKVAVGHAAPREIFHISKGEETIASRISCKISPWRQWECLDSAYGFAWGIAADDKKFHLHYDTPMGTVSGHLMCVDALNSRVGFFTDTPATEVHVLTAGATELRVESSGAYDPQFCLKTTNTPHEVDFALDESAVADHVDFIGQTASVDTYFHVVAQSGRSAKLGVQVGSYRGELICGSAGHVSLRNVTSNLDLILGISDGGVAKSITWDADIDKLKHSHGLFDFDNDNIQTSGYIALRSNAEVRFYDNGNYVGFEAPALSGNQIWVLPSADGPANEVLGTDNSGNIIWRTHDELAGRTHDGDTLQHDGVNSNGGAFPFTTSGAVTFSQTVIIANGASINLQEDITFTGATAQNLVKFPDNLPTALDFREAGTSYLLFRTSDGTEGVTIGKPLTLSSIAAGDADYDKFLVSHTGLIKYRTGVQLLSDIGAAAASHAMATHSDETTYNIATSGTLTIARDTSAADASIRLNETSTGDPAIQFQLGGTTKWSIGCDNSVNDAFNISSHANLGTNAAISINPSTNLVTLYSLAVTTGTLTITGLQVATNQAFITVNDTPGNWESYFVHMVGGVGKAGLRYDSGTDIFSLCVNTHTTARLSIDNAGDITVGGCLSDGTCEIMKGEDALAIIDDILKTGSGKKDEYNHERMDMKKIHAKYPFMIEKQRVKIYEDEGSLAPKEIGEEDRYYDKLGAKSDLIYVAIGQLKEKIKALEASL